MPGSHSDGHSMPGSYTVVHFLSLYPFGLVPEPEFAGETQWLYSLIVCFDNITHYRELRKKFFVGQTTFLIRPRCSDLWGIQSCDRTGETWGCLKEKKRKEKNRYVQVPLSSSFLKLSVFILLTLRVIAISFPGADLYSLGLGYLQACGLTAQRINRLSLHCQ